MTPTPVSNKAVLDSVEEIKVAIAEMRSTFELRLTRLEEQAKRQNDALYGNGSPGIREVVRRHDEQLNRIETQGTDLFKAVASDVNRLNVVHQGCQVGKIEECLARIEERHLEEDHRAEQQAKDAAAERAEVRAENREMRTEERKLRAAIVLFLITTVVTWALQLADRLLPK